MYRTYLRTRSRRMPGTLASRMRSSTSERWMLARCAGVLAAASTVVSEPVKKAKAMEPTSMTSIEMTRSNQVWGVMSP